MLTIHVRYFAALREALGGSETLQVPPGTTLGGLRDLLIARGADHAHGLARGRAVRTAVAQVMADDESLVLADGAEVAFFPPVTGG